jgi:hypothetical protein
VRNYGAPADSNAVPRDVAVGSDGRVVVVGPRVVLAGIGERAEGVGPEDLRDGERAWNVRCYDHTGHTLWTHDLRALHDPTMLSLDVRGAYHVRTDNQDRFHIAVSGSARTVAQSVVRLLAVTCSQDGEVLQFVYGGEDANAAVELFDVSPDGGMVVVNTYSGPSVVSRSDIAFLAYTTPFLPGVSEALVLETRVRSDVLQPASLQLVEYPSSSVVTAWVSAPELDEDRLAGVVTDGARAVVRGGPIAFDGRLHNLAQLHVTTAEIGDVLWAHECRVWTASHQLAVSRATGRCAVILRGSYDDDGLRWPSLACIDVDGNLLWSHCHAGDSGYESQTAIGEDQSVAVISGPLRVGYREWDFLNSLSGV